ncbi:tRNA-uridine aminocarboxypropyltransferase [Halobacteriovorax sp.]|uniref:tRNA-uridine aminocarboxypropyltransferase n=1 Tax=Halobacteriovorax sp. TaxID=2020862 RepID=UPI00356A86F8
MSREYCEVCTRALRGCICKYTTTTLNKTPVTILRHPSEIKSLKGTAQLLLLSLSNIRLFDGEEFNQVDIILPNVENILVFPSENSIRLKDFANKQETDNKKHFIFIDGTWKKAYKILQLNTYLKDITHMCLELESDSPYAEVRKQKSGGLSTLEAVVMTLKEFEGDELYRPLEKSFNQFIEYLKKLST